MNKTTIAALAAMASTALIGTAQAAEIKFPADEPVAAASWLAPLRIVTIHNNKARKPARLP